MAPVGSKPSLTEIRAGVLRRPGLMCAPLREALVEAYDAWLGARLPCGAPGVALVAVGSYGRREPSPSSDLDLVLLHTGSADGVTGLADSIWYPIWDSGIGLDHAVRTADQTVAVARGDLKALLGMLDVRHIAGDAGLAAGLRERVVALWRASAAKRMAELREISQARWAAAGDGAFLLEPNLKDSRGGLRDVQLLHALALAQLVDLPPAARVANSALLDVRGELHRVTGRPDDVLRLQELDPVASSLGLTDDAGDPDRDEVLRRVNHAARTVAHALDIALHRIEAMSSPSPWWRRRTRGAPVPGPVREGIARDVVAQDGEVVLARDAAPESDPGLVVRAARAAAEVELPLGAYTLERLAAQAAPLPEPWPREVRDDFVTLLGTGAAAVPVLEALDFAGLLSRLIPEWDAVRTRAQHNPVHRYTVDRHLLEAAAHAAERTRDVDRPDLLLVGALLHDIGKGYPGDHSVVGAERTGRIACRMGFDDHDVEVITALTRHHLLLPDTATRRDPDDPVTVRIVTEAVGGDAQLLELLYALVVADAAATGPAAWSDWKGGLVAELVGRSRSVLRGDELAPPTPLDAERRALAEAGQLAVRVRDREVVVAARDGVGVLYRTAGVLALHLLNIRSASIRTYAGMAVNSFVVESRFGRVPDAALLRADLTRALDGELPLAERLREKERAYAHPARGPEPATVHWFDDEATDATVLEYRAADVIGLLCRVTAALERCQLDVRSARVSSVAGSVVDAFYVTTRDGRPVPSSVRADVEIELRRV
jgi:[protein-PII] uridylyltransferase